MSQLSLSYSRKIVNSLLSMEFVIYSSMQAPPLIGPTIIDCKQFLWRTQLYG